MADMQLVLAGEEEKKVEAQYVEMKVPLYSYGCERKIKKALAHLKGVLLCCLQFYAHTYSDVLSFICSFFL